MNAVWPGGYTCLSIKCRELQFEVRYQVVRLYKGKNICAVVTVVGGKNLDAAYRRFDLLRLPGNNSAKVTGHIRKMDADPSL